MSTNRNVMSNSAATEAKSAVNCDTSVVAVPSVSVLTNVVRREKAWLRVSSNC